MTGSRRVWLLVPLALGVSLAFLWLGGESLSWNELLQSDSTSRRILFELRLPRLILVLLAGAVLSMLGGTYQILFHNPLAEPYVLGVSSAVTLGIAIGEVFLHVPAHSAGGMACGFLSAAVATVALILICRRDLGEVMDRVVLFGMGLNFVLSSLLFLILSFVYQHMGGGSLRWLFGQVPWVSAREVASLVAVCLPLMFFLWLQGRSLDALSLGDGVAETLGVRPVSARPRILVVSSALLAVIVTLTGSIGFVGLVVPHAARLLFRPASTRALFAQAACLGALFLAISDLASRALLPPMEFPIGILTTLIGGPLFLWILWKR